MFRERDIRPYLDQPVDWEPFDDFIFGEFEDTEQSEHDPIRQPLRVVGFRSRFDGLDPKMTKIR